MRPIWALAYTLLILFGIQTSLQAQPAVGDSLKRQLARSLPDTSRVNVLMAISQHFFGMPPAYNPDSATHYGKEALTLSQKIGYTRGEARAYLHLGGVRYEIGDYVTALEYSQKSLQRYESLNDTLGIIRSLRLFSSIYYFRSDYRKELANYLTIAQLARQIKDEDQLAYTLLNISLTYTRPTVVNLDSAEYYANEVLRMKTVSDADRAEILAIKAEVYKQRKAYRSAANYLLQALRAFERLDNQTSLYYNRLSLGEVYQKLNRLDSALYVTRLAYQQYPASADSLNMKKEAGYQLGTIYQTLKQYEPAARYFQLAYQAQQAIDEKGEKQKFLDLEYQEKQRQLELQAAKAEYDSRIRLYALLGGLLLVSAVSIILYRNNRQQQRANGLLQQQRDEINQQHDQLQQSMEKLRATQAQLIQQEKLASLGELTAGIAHEIQNTLNFVNNFSEVSAELVEEIQDERQKTKEARDEALEEELLADLKENLNKIRHHGKRAESIVKGMLDHSRASSGEKRPTDLNALADEYLRLSYHGVRAKDKSFNVTLNTSFRELPPLTVAPQELGRVLLNLYNNAFYALQEKQKQAGQGFQPQVWVGTEIIDGKVQIQVKDNGTGIPTEILNKIYQPFFTTKPTGQGTGLGLSLSYDIVTKGHNGEMQVQSQPGEGTEFLIRLPARA